MIPESDVARHWLLITGIYSLLEQSLKFLLNLEDETYDRNKMLNDRHGLYVVYQKLPDEYQDVLRQYFEEYVSLLGITGLKGLDQYLKEKGAKDRYGKWRYFLIERDLAQLDEGQTRPFSTDLMLEIIHGVLDIARAKITEHEIGINSVSYRLERKLGSRLAPYEADDSNEAEITAWLKNNPCIMNACSRWLRARQLEKLSPFMSTWVDKTMRAALEDNANLDVEYNMAIFKRRAGRSCFMWDGRRFVTRNPLPDSVDDLTLQGEWSVGWSVDQMSWNGRMRRALTQVPTRLGQTIRIAIDGVFQDAHGNPMDASHLQYGTSNETVGDLAIWFDGKKVVEMTAKPTSVLGAYWGDPSELSRNYFITFVKTDRDGEFPTLIHGLQCIACLGTGFCSECLGESENDDCECVGGLCSDCKGYGEDGQHLLAQVANPKPAWMNP